MMTGENRRPLPEIDAETARVPRRLAEHRRLSPSGRHLMDERQRSSSTASRNSHSSVDTRSPHQVPCHSLRKSQGDLAAAHGYRT